MRLKPPKARSLSWAFVAIGYCCGIADADLLRWEGRTMGSPYTVQVVTSSIDAKEAEAVKAEIEAALKEVNRQMSHYDPQSDLSKFNRAPANIPFKVSGEFARVMDFTLDLCRKTGGALDPTVAPVVNLWGFGEQGGKPNPPSQEQIDQARKKIGYRHLSLTREEELLKDLDGIAINLSAVAKGFGVDQMIRVLIRHGLTNAYASIAGEVRVLGRNASGGKWRVGISEPIPNWNENDPMADLVLLSDQAISTSGDYQKFVVDEQGNHYSHIFDPRTGRPVQNNIAGVSVVAPDSMTADGLSTALFVLGLEKGTKFVNGLTNTAALFIVRGEDGELHEVPTENFSRLTR